MYLKKIALILVALMFLPLFCFANERNITMVTYCPSPYGAYNELDTNKLRVGETDNELDQGVIQFEPLNDNDPEGSEGGLYYKGDSHEFRYKDNIGWKSFGGSFYYRRSAAIKKDKILWCPDAYPNLISCMVADDEAGPSVALGALDLNDKAPRGNLGGDLVYTERVKSPTADVYGCMSYAENHSHAPYII
ncbi:MAG: hypothetical protein P9L96_03685 [Candidatus Gygaella obscura]|nr:hypothetical protein [Candidatus Gygaella obscura]